MTERDVAAHDPKFAAQGRTGADGQPCNRDCPGPWPCAVRLRYRARRKGVLAVLQSDLYDIVGRGANSLVWRSPLGWIVHESMSEAGNVALSVHDPRDGHALASTDDADEFAYGMLP